MKRITTWIKRYWHHVPSALKLRLMLSLGFGLGWLAEYMTLFPPHIRKAFDAAINVIWLWSF